MIGRLTNFGLLMLLLSACTTTMDVKHVTDKNDDVEGIRYFLPRPYLLVSPAADGTITVETVYLPDLSEQYAITTKSIVAKHKLSVELDDHGFLKSFGTTSDSTDLAKTSIEQAGALQKARMDAAQKESDKAAEAAKKKKDAVAAADDAVTAAKAEVQDTEDEIKVLQEAVNDASGAAKDDFQKKLVDAKVRLEKAKNKEKAAEKAVEDLKNAALDFPHAMNLPVSMISAFMDDATARGTQASATLPKVWGPVLFAMVDTFDTDRKETVRLVPVDQKLFRTQAIAEKGDKKQTTSEVTPKLNVREEVRIGQGVAEFTIDSDTDIVELNQLDSRLRSEGIRVLFLKAMKTVPADPKRVRITLDHDIPAGDYSLELVYSVMEGEKKAQKSTRVVFRVTR